ncbi:FkbM family methyltransferase [Frigidibacter oleivorans]|uniref:FkbM family methyltransferase n=1 Tax=Frigidibacter oleivorans TaxID=2487129 RepID=UPI000F8DD80B|nr:FkbM family methyltransferase [Frigidibacter oleivorans]
MEAAGAVRLLLDRLAGLGLPRVADVGANPINEPPYAGLLAMGGCEVVGFEPQPDAFAELDRSKGPLETYLPHAVGEGGPVDLRIYRSSGLTSVFEPHRPGMAYLGVPGWSAVKARVPMQTVALDAAEGLGRIDLLKIDIQGGELGVFRGGRQVLAQAVAVIVEQRYYRLYDGEPMLAATDAELRDQGFTLHRLLPVKMRALPNSQMARLRKRRVQDQAVDGDVVYIRDPAGMGDWSDRQVAMLALLASAVWDSHSLTLHCLDALVARGAAVPDLPAAYVDALPARFRADAAEPGQGQPADAAMTS